MSKITFSNDEFRCHLECDQCVFIKPDGQRCRNRVCIGYPVCWVHTKKEYGLRVKDSTIAEAGKGLFTLTGVENGEWICPYVGEQISQECLDARYPGDQTAPYAVADGQFVFGDFDDLVNENIQGFIGSPYIDSACVRGVGAMANGLFRRDGRSRTAAVHNATIDARPGYAGLWLRARKDIEPDSEIFVHYGPQYTLDDEHVTSRRQGIDTRPC